MIIEMLDGSNWRDRIAAIRAADARDPGSTLKAGDSIGVWELGEHPYGRLANYPFCGTAQDYTSFYYNGPGRPPSYAFSCGECGVKGPLRWGGASADELGGRIEAVERWNVRA